MKRFWIINLILFQASWFSAAFYTTGAAWIIAGLLMLHFLLTPTPRADLKLLPLVLPGICVDALHLLAGTYSAGETLFPIWLILLWSMFVISLNHSLNWLIKSPKVVLVAFGSAGGTASYWAGIQAGALQSTWSTEVVITVLMLAWGILLPLLVIGYRYLIPAVNLEQSR